MSAPDGRLVQAVQDLSHASSISEVQAIVRTAARELVGADGATFVLRDGDQCFYADEDAIAPLWKGQRLPLEVCISGWAMIHREGVVIPDIYQDPRIPQDAYRLTFVKSLVMVPVRRRDPVGAIGTYWAQERQATDRELALLQALADSTALAIENVRHVQELELRRRQDQETLRLATSDDLTGLPNRRGFHLLANQQLERVRRSAVPAALLFVDLDGLKRVNDTEGHVAGDDMLRRMADVLRHTFRGEDVLGRLGGDEFVVLVLGHGLSPATMADRLRIEMRRESAGAGSLRASVGIAHYEAGMTLDALLARADAAMYVDKLAREDRLRSLAVVPRASSDDLRLTS